MEFTEADKRRFWEKVWTSTEDDHPDACWVWMGGLFGGMRYGAFSLNRVPRLAHRVSYALHHGGIPDSDGRINVVMHACDNARCVRPDHLVLGTQQENIKDAWRKGRATVEAASAVSRAGESNGRAALTRAKVEALRAAWSTGGHTKKGLARAYGISDTQVSRILNREVWKTAA